MAKEDQTKETVKVEASDLKAVEHEPTAVQENKKKQKTYSVPRDGVVYKVEADSATEANEKADDIIKLNKKDK